ncbi:MAG: MATE family efflux transporter [Lachnospiraceae bacterium]|nr:MATE family efflux transporter [Lachnospiraceae bacterium]MCI1656315.1 MATE family efflux transporter [Lachnospiraceae bacterium]MCI2194797.1 MATE family efflux transporter [Lachnospiraceae bacterium]
MANDFSRGKVWRIVLAQAVPLTLASFVQLLYNVVDRIYIGHLSGSGGMALTGVGVTFPIVTLVLAFTMLFASGGAPLFSMARGAGDTERASRLQSSTLTLLLICAVLITVIGLALGRPILYLFGATAESYPYAAAYFRIYILGTLPVMFATGMNYFINAQGFPKIGMLTTVLGALINLGLDPVFIFALHLGVSGAAIATVISQAVSALWVLRFLTGSQCLIPICRAQMRPDLRMAGQIVQLGLAGFVQQGTNSLVQIVCNLTLRNYGGAVYVGVMTILNSVREILHLPIMGLTTGSQPVMGFNYGARKYERVKSAIRFNTAVGVTFLFAAWIVVLLFPHLFVSLFTNDPELIRLGIPAMHRYFFGFFLMGLQFSGQAVFTALGYAKRAIFFSLFRKVIIVVPLTLLLPAMGMGVSGVFTAEPVSNAIGGIACAVTMYVTVYRKLGKEDREPVKEQNRGSMQ